MKRWMITAAVLFWAASTALGNYGLRPWRVNVVNEFGETITGGSFTITVKTAGTNSNATIYSSTDGTAKTNPVTPGNDAAAGAGTLNFYAGPTITSLDFVITSSVYAQEIHHLSVGITQHRLVFPAWNHYRIVFEGTTHDANEVVLTVTDPNRDVVLTLPDYTGGIPVVIGQTADDQTTIDGADAVDVNGTSLVIVDEFFAAGKAVRYTLAGTKTGANGTLMIYLYLDDGIQCTLTSGGNTAGDWWAQIVMAEHTDFAHQTITGVLVTADGVVTDLDTDTTNFADGGNTTVKCQIDLGHGDDEATVDYVLIEHWNK